MEEIKNTSQNETTNTGQSGKSDGRRNGSKMNAIKTGLYAQGRVIRTKFYEESVADFQQTREGLSLAYAPQGALEEELLDRIAHDLHCLKRGELFESAVKRINEKTRIEQLKETFGIGALDESITKEAKNLSLPRHALESISKLDVWLCRLDQLDMLMYKDSLAALRYVVNQGLNFAEQVMFERAIQLNRLNVFFVKKYGLDTNQSFKKIKKSLEEQVQSSLEKKAAMVAERKKLWRALRKQLKEENLQCLIPQGEDLGRLGVFYSTHLRRMSRLLEMLAKTQEARLIAARISPLRQLPQPIVHQEVSMAGASGAIEVLNEVCEPCQPNTSITARPLMKEGTLNVP